MNRTIALLFLLLAGLVSACRSAKSPAEGGVRLYVDEVEVRTLTIATPAPLARVVTGAAADPSRWKRIEAFADAGRFLDVAQPARTYPGAEVRIYSDHGKAAIGIFRPVKPGLAPRLDEIARQPSVFLVGITEIRIRTDAAPPLPVASAPGGKPLEVVVAGRGTEKIPSEEIEELPEQTGERTQIRGWALRDIAVFSAGENLGRVTVEGSDGASATIEAASLDSRERARVAGILDRDLAISRQLEKAAREGLVLRIDRAARVQIEKMSDRRHGVGAGFADDELGCRRVRRIAMIVASRQ